jgi:hypothetical protein
MIRFKADGKTRLEIWATSKIVEPTFQVDPNVICVEDLELADYMASLTSEV